MKIPPNENPSPHPGLHPCDTCYGWGSYSALMAHGYESPPAPGDPAPMFDACPGCDGRKWVEVQERLPL